MSGVGEMSSLDFCGFNSYNGFADTHMIFDYNLIN